jgi:hypothetical protein
MKVTKKKKREEEEEKEQLSFSFLTFWLYGAVF